MVAPWRIGDGLDSSWTEKMTVRWIRLPVSHRPSPHQRKITRTTTKGELMDANVAEFDCNDAGKNVVLNRSLSVKTYHVVDGIR
nr:hypothetical protein Iba_chr04fCG1490 [Ipomoea batatas]GMD83960.1 hypothetical protein Iba_scaffold52767CG0010 [Ipomoea batatas]